MTSGLRLFDVDYSRGTLFISGGKADKQRFVPVGESSLCLLESYVNEMRPVRARILRHTAAVLMVEGGADVLYVQELLGHAQITATQRQNVSPSAS